MLFEMLILEGAQAGLSWRTVLRKRDNYRAALDGFDPAVVAGYGRAEIDALMGDPGIIRHRGKLEATVANARAFLAIQASHGSFEAYLWGFVDGDSQPLPFHERGPGVNAAVRADQQGP